MANSVDPDKMSRLRHLIRVCIVCKGLSVPILRVITVIILLAVSEDPDKTYPCLQNTFPFIGLLQAQGGTWMTSTDQSADPCFDQNLLLVNTYLNNLPYST